MKQSADTRLGGSRLTAGGWKLTDCGGRLRDVCGLSTAGNWRIFRVSNLRSPPVLLPHALCGSPAPRPGDALEPSNYSPPPPGTPPCLHDFCTPITGITVTPDLLSPLPSSPTTKLAFKIHSTWLTDPTSTAPDVTGGRTSFSFPSGSSPRQSWGGTGRLSYCEGAPSMSFSVMDPESLCLRSILSTRLLDPVLSTNTRTVRGVGPVAGGVCSGSRFALWLPSATARRGCGCCARNSVYACLTLSWGGTGFPVWRRVWGS